MKINFEQLMEEVRELYPQAVTVIGTESPLSVTVDGIPAQMDDLLAAHHAVWVRVNPSTIKADGLASACVSVECPAMAGITISIQLRLGSTELIELLDLNAAGQADLDVCTYTAGEIHIQAIGFRSRALLLCE